MDLRCKRTACQAPITGFPLFIHRDTRDIYCADCSRRINEACGEKVVHTIGRDVAKRLADAFEQFDKRRLDENAAFELACKMEKVSPIVNADNPNAPVSYTVAMIVAELGPRGVIPELQNAVRKALA